MVLIVAISGCAGMPQRPAVVPPPPGAREKLVAAGKALEKTRAEIAAFQADLGAVRARIAALRSRPWWAGFERILREYPVLTDPNGEGKPTPPMQSRLNAWSRESKVSWQTAMRDYFQLVNRCAILDMRRVAVRQMLISVQAAYMAVVMMDASAGDARDAQKIFALVNSLDKPGADLEALRLNRLGLYEVPPGANSSH
jgi:hypothetical protein